MLLTEKSIDKYAKFIGTHDSYLENFLSFPVKDHKPREKRGRQSEWTFDDKFYPSPRDIYFTCHECGAMNKTSTDDGISFCYYYNAEYDESPFCPSDMCCNNILIEACINCSNCKQDSPYTFIGYQKAVGEYKKQRKLKLKNKKSSRLTKKRKKVVSK